MSDDRDSRPSKGRLSSPRGRKALGIGLLSVGLLLLMGLAAMAYNRHNLGAESLERGLERLINRTRTATRLAAAECKVRPLRPVQSAVLRLEDRLPEARCEPLPGIGRGVEGPTAPLALDFSPGDGVTWVATFGEVQSREGVLELRGEPLAQVESVDLPPVAVSEVGAIELVLRSPRGGWLEIGLSRDAEAVWTDRWGDERLRLIPLHLPADNELRSYRVRTAGLLRHHVTPGERIRKILLRASRSPLYLESLRFLPRTHPYQGVDCDSGYEDIAGEMRRVLHTWSGIQLGFEVRVPESSPTLTLGTGALLPDARICTCRLFH